MAHEHPFQNLFESLGRLPLAHAESVNRQAYQVLHDILSVPLDKPGRCIMLRAPRAGHGKTHLLSRVQHHLGATHEFIPLHPAFGCQIDAATVIEDILRRLLRPLPASGGLCVLDLLTRRLFALALQPLVSSGEVPCQDREGALAALRARPIETFDFHHPNAVTAHWARENFEVLGQRLAIELARRCGLPVREIAFWVDTMFRFAATPVENPARMRALTDAVQDGHPGQGILMERTEALIGMMTLLMRVVLVADELEGFSSDQSAALRFAAFLGALRQSVERIDVILSINQDIWESAFVPRLSGGLADRLSEVLIELKPLKENEMVELLESRVPGLGRTVLDRIDREFAGNHARGLIRAAGMAWLRATAGDSAPAAAPPVEVPLPVPAAADDRTEEILSGTDVSPVEGETTEDVPVSVDTPPVPTAGAESASAGESLPADWPRPELPEEIPQTVPDVSAEAPPEETPVGDENSGFTMAPAEPVPSFSPEEPSPITEHAGAIDVSVEPSSPFEAVEPPELEQSDIYGTASAPSLTPVPEPQISPVAATPEPSGEETPGPVPDTDRVDELLRKFRERYGRTGS